MSTDGHEVVELWFAASMVGATRTGVTPRFSQAGIEHVLRADIDAGVATNAAAVTDELDHDAMALCAAASGSTQTSSSPPDRRLRR